MKYGKRPKPVPVLNLRCEWCKRLFAWKTPRMGSYLPGNLRRFCSNGCGGKWDSWRKGK